VDKDNPAASELYVKTQGRQIKEHGYADKRPGDYEEDHLISYAVNVSSLSGYVE